MALYQLYLESGPRRKTTMVHVLDPLGCMIWARTTEAALAAIADAIQAYLAFLCRHGEEVPGSDEAIETQIAEHVTEGFWLGRGSPSILFGPEREPVSLDEVDRYLRWLDWAQEEILALVGGMSGTELDAPYEGGRTLREILKHVWESELWYVKNLGPLPQVQRSGDIFVKMAAVRKVVQERLLSLSGEGQAAVVYVPGPFSSKGGDPWTVRKAIRRCLEHQWEHLDEISQRVGGIRDFQNRIAWQPVGVSS